VGALLSAFIHATLFMRNILGETATIVCQLSDKGKRESCAGRSERRFCLAIYRGLSANAISTFFIRNGVNPGCSPRIRAMGADATRIAAGLRTHQEAIGAAGLAMGRRDRGGSDQRCSYRGGLVRAAWPTDPQMWSRPEAIRLLGAARGRSSRRSSG
jgi:hypothetical protein